jgi:hypothetical protein
MRSPVSVRLSNSELTNANSTKACREAFADECASRHSNFTLDRRISSVLLTIRSESRQLTEERSTE